jgi:hypothetical protein
VPSATSGTSHAGTREWRWPRGGKIKFAHLQFDATVYDWQGAQIRLDLLRRADPFHGAPVLLHGPDVQISRTDPD